MEKLICRFDARLARGGIQYGVSLLAMVGLLLGTLPSPVQAGGVPAGPGPAVPWPWVLPAKFTVQFTELECVDETGDGGAERRHADEPYVVMFIADISQVMSRVRIAKTEIFRGMNDGAQRFADVRLWGIEDAPEPISNPNDVIILVAVMEHDDMDRDARIAWMGNAMVATLARFRAVGWPHDRLVGALKETMRSILSVKPTLPRPRYDDLIGDPQELRLTTDDLERARRGEDVLLPPLDHRGGDGHYRTHFFLGRRP